MRTKWMVFLGLLAMLLLAIAVHADAPGFAIDWYVVSGGGGVPLAGHSPWMAACCSPQGKPAAAIINCRAASGMAQLALRFLHRSGCTCRCCCGTLRPTRMAVAGELAPVAGHGTRRGATRRGAIHCAPTHPIRLPAHPRR